jgi:hypothetical protein
MLLSMLLPIGGGIAAKAGLSRLLAKTALPSALKKGLPIAVEWGTFLSPQIYDAMKTPPADDGAISSNHGQMAQLNNMLASSPPPPDNLQALMSLMEQESARSSGQGDDLMSMLQQRVI